MPAHAGPSFAHVDSHASLVAASKTYCERARDRYGFAVDLSRVEWAVSTRAKRRAAAVKTPTLPDASIGDEYDWSGVNPARRRCTVSLTWAAFEAFDDDEWAETLRHELVHVEEFQRFGTTSHGPRFRDRATAVDATLRCRRFATPAYVLECTACDAVVARRYRKCELVRTADRRVSTCCRASLRCREPAEDD